MKRKLRIAWICPYPITEFIQIIKEYPVNPQNIHPATWLKTLSKEFNNRNGIELYIISFSSYLRRDIFLKKNGIYYYFLDRRLKKINKGIILQLIYHYPLMRKVKTIIRSIQPDIINLHGTEHDLSNSINQQFSIPIVVEIQGFVNSLIKINNSYYNKLCLKVENNIFKNQKNFIIHTKFMSEIIKNINPNAKFYYTHYPISSYIFKLDNEPITDDIVFWGRIVKEKGVDDFIEAAYLVKKKIPGLKIKIMGLTPKPSYVKHLKKRINQLALNSNINFIGFIPKHIDLIKEVKRSKIVVFPTYADTSPGTIGESQGAGVPVISYKVDGVPDMIENGVNGVLVNKGDIETLSKSIIDLLNNDNKRKLYAKSSKEFALSNYNVKPIVDKMINIYKEVLSKAKVS